MAKRPENQLPPELYYGESEAIKYTRNSRIIEIQTEMCERAVELLALPEDASDLLILDIGCGSGISGQCLTDLGHHWIGFDISRAMLDVALDSDVDGSLALGDMGQGLPFRAGMFDAVISISALQWLCNADSSSSNPIARQRTFFTSLFACMASGARAVMQFYPADEQQMQLLLNSAMIAGFSGGLVTDYPNSTKARKHFLVLDTSGSSTLPSPEGGNDVRTKHKIPRVPPKGSKAWILHKKERHQRRNPDQQLPRDSKFSGRKRKSVF